MDQKPITLLREDFINSLSTLINTSQLPMFIVEQVLRQFTIEVTELSNQQLELDRQRYLESLQNVKNLDSDDSEIVEHVE